MLTLRPAHARGHADHGWLDTYHSFSFANYHDPEHMGCGALRVLNEDLIQPGQGFGTHPHRNMEILTYLLSGELEHRDSLGHGAILRRGDLQYMCAGTGVTHSEFNPSPDEPTHLLQIWIVPDAAGHAPRYDQRHLEPDDLRGQWHLLAAPAGEDAPIAMHQDARLYARVLAPGETATFPVTAPRRQYLHVARGSLQLQGMKLAAGDAVRVEAEAELQLLADTETEVLLFDLA